MSLEDALSAPPPRKNHNSGCSFGHWLHTLDETQRESIRKALDDPRWEHAALQRTLEAEVDMPIGVDPLRRHRKGGCKCESMGLT